MKAAEPFWSAPASSPAFLRIDSSLLVAFEGWPRITPPAKGKRIFQLRTYESPSYRDHILKVQMFHSGEFEIFKNAGFQMVFFGDTLIGQRMPSLTYMLSFADSAELDAKVESIPQRSGVEEALRRSEVRVRSDCQQHHQPDSEPAGSISGLIESYHRRAARRAPMRAASSSRLSSSSRAAASCIPPIRQGIVTTGLPPRLNGTV